MKIIESAFIAKKTGEITLSLFRSYIQTTLGFCEAGEHNELCSLTGKPRFNSGEGVVYFISENYEPSYIKFRNDDRSMYDGVIDINNVEESIVEKIAYDLNAEIHMVYMHG